MSNSSSSKFFRFVGALTRLGKCAEASINEHEIPYLFVTASVFTLFAIYRSLTTPLWFDELFTLFISRLSSLPAYLRAMPVDNQPPLGPLLTHISLGLFGQSEFPVRLPEFLGYIASGLLTYKIVRRRGSAVQSLFAMSLLMGAIVNKTQAITARPYELMLVFTAVAFSCWQAATERQGNRLLPLCGITVGVAGAILSHHFGLVHVGLLLGAGEVTRLLNRRKLDWPLLTAVAVGLTPLAFTLRLAGQSKLLLGEAVMHSTNFWAKPTFVSLKTYQSMAALPLLYLVIGLAIVLWPWHVNSHETESITPVPAHEWAAATALALLLPVQLVVTAIATNYFLPRYAIATSLGLAVLAAWGLPRIGRVRAIAQPVLALSILCFVLIIATTVLLAQIRHPAQRARLDNKAISPLLSSAPFDLPLVVANGLDYAPEWWYAPEQIRQRLIYLTDLSYSERQPDFLPELSLAAGQSYIPMPVADYAQFVAGHSNFLLLASGDARLVWLPKRLSAEGWFLRPIATRGKDVLYRVDRPAAPTH